MCCVCTTLERNHMAYEMNVTSTNRELMGRLYNIEELLKEIKDKL